MTKYNIESNVPMTETRGTNARYPFRQMNVGDSFEFPSKEAPSVRSGANYIKVKDGVEFTVRKVSKTTHRCWRIK